MSVRFLWLLSLYFQGMTPCSAPTSFHSISSPVLPSPPPHNAHYKWSCVFTLLYAITVMCRLEGSLIYLDQDFQTSL